MFSSKNFRRRFVIFVLVGAFLMSAYVAPIYAAPPIPFRIGGTVTINGVAITQATDTGLLIKVTKQNGTDYTPVAQDSVGLNASNWYIVDIPIFNAVDQPGGANTGETAVIHVYLNGNELSVTSPVNAQLTVGATGANSQINLVATTQVVPVPVISNFSASPTSIQLGGTSTLSWTITGATSASINNGVGTVTATAGSIAVSPTTSTTYTLTATNASGPATSVTTVNVQSSAVSVPTISEWGMIILALGFGIAGFFYMKKNSMI
jgi:hypothetical protein